LQEDAAWRRRLLLAAGVTLVAAVCVAAILLAGSRSQEASRGSASEEAAQSTAPERATAEDRPPAEAPRPIDENEALVADARSYAKSFDVSLEEAIRRLKMQDDPFLSRLDRELRETAPDTYVELRLRHRPDYGITLAFTGDPQAAMDKVKPLVEGAQWEGTVRIDRVELTVEELEAIATEADRIVARLGMTQVSSGLNTSMSPVELFVPNKAKFQRHLRASGLELPEHVVVIESTVGPLVPE
jgi:hypothetical protein